MEHTSHTLSAELDTTGQSLLDIIEAISTENIDRVPFEGSWTAGQVMEHIDKAVGAEVLFGGSEKADRVPDERIPMIKSVFLDFNAKYTAPDFIQPVSPVHDKQEYLKIFKSTFDKLKQAAGTLDLTEICTDLTLPGFGPMTRYELICLMMYHTRRHVLQLKRIAAAFQ